MATAGHRDHSGIGLFACRAQFLRSVNRPVRMTPRSRRMLERAWEERTGPFVLDHAGAIRTSFEHAVERAELEDVTPHVLRHTWATRAAQNGVPIRQIADQLADDIRTVEKNYYHHSPEYMHEAASWRDKETEAAMAKKAKEDGR